jgi:hypothetical protein
MRHRIPIIVSVAAAAIFVAAYFVRAPDAESERLQIVFTEVHVTGEEGPVTDWSYPSESRIVLEEFGSASPSRKILTEDFASARTGDLSFDAQNLLFSGRRELGDSWQIWEMDLRSGKATQMTEGFFRATDPAYLPDGRFVFAAALQEGEPHALYVTDRDGSGVSRITFHPQDDRAPVVLPDGRLLFVSGNPTASKILSMRYDGTGAGLYYKDDTGGPLPFRPRLTEDRHLYFIDSRPFDGTTRGRLSRVSDARPLHSRVDYFPVADGEFQSVYPLSDEVLLVSYRDAPDSRFAVRRFLVASAAMGPPLHRHEDYHAIDALLVRPRVAPMGFVSTVSVEAETGWLYCLDADLSTLPASDGAARAAGGTVRVLGLNGAIGEIPVESDGSFYVELPADTPLRFQTLGPNGQPVRGPSSWIWVRPGVQRGCIGCHENRELAPDNVVPLAVTRSPSSLADVDDSMVAHASTSESGPEATTP